MDKHLTRQQLIGAARGELPETAEHLAACPECRAELALISTYALAGEPPLPHAPEDWIARAAGLAQGVPVVEKLRRLLAVAVFDSWAVPSMVGVRGGATTEDRRLRFESEGMTFYLRAERQAKSWAFVAQLTGEAGRPETTLEVDKRTITPDESGLYVWSAGRPPRKISLRTGPAIIDLPELSWKKPRSS